MCNSPFFTDLIIGSRGYSDHPNLAEHVSKIRVALIDDCDYIHGTRSSFIAAAIKKKIFQAKRTESYDT